MRTWTTLLQEKGELERYIHNAEGGNFMDVWSKTLEGAVKDLARQHKVEHADVKGHGVVKIRTKKEDFSGEVDEEKNELCNSNRSKEARRLAKQMRRNEAIKELNRISQRGKRQWHTCEHPEAGARECCQGIPQECGHEESEGA